MSLFKMSTVKNDSNQKKLWVKSRIVEKRCAPAASRSMLSLAGRFVRSTWGSLWRCYITKFVWHDCCIGLTLFFRSLFRIASQVAASITYLSFRWKKLLNLILTWWSTFKSLSSFRETFCLFFWRNFPQTVFITPVHHKKVLLISFFQHSLWKHPKNIINNFLMK
jgi:hypothetical protein